MVDHQAVALPETVLSEEIIRDSLQNAFSGQFKDRRVLVLIPDATRTVPLPQLFRLLVEALQDSRQLDFMVALGTHPALSEERLNRLVGISPEARSTFYRHVGLLNHDWESGNALVRIGVLPQEQIQAIAGEHWHPTLGGDVDVVLNRAVLAYDHVIILGPTFPHEVAGFSGGAKYFFPGISGPEMIHVSHWLGALAGVRATIGVKDTPVRAMIHAAADSIPVPVTLVALVVVGESLAGLFIGDYLSAWSAAADLSSERHIVRVDRPFERILSCAPPMYEELWTAGKAMYKLEPALAAGGELIIYAPHLDTVSRAHGRFMYEIGYHSLPYFLNQWERFKHIPLGVLAHSTHVRGSGGWVGGREVARARVTLASKIPPEDCEKLNLGYLDPAGIDSADWIDRETDGVLYVPKAGEMLYRVKD